MSEPPAMPSARADAQPVSLRVGQFLRSLASACPYVLAARALLRWGRIILGRSDGMEGRGEKRLLDGVKMGRNIALIGFFCPFFWAALFGGAEAAKVRFNAIHSGGVVLVGLLWMVKSLVQVELARRRMNPAGQAGAPRSRDV